MANQTTNYELVKPLASEFYDVEVQNENMDKIDAGMKANADGIKTLQNGQKNKADLVGGKVPSEQLPAMDYEKRGTAASTVGTHNENEAAHPYLLEQIEGCMTAVENHTHSATEIATGTLNANRLPTVPVTKGGTGATTADAARTNLGAAAESHNHSASDINSGTLNSSRLPTVPVAKGGTGATTAASALTNLGAAAADHTHDLSDIKGFLTVIKSNNIYLRDHSGKGLCLIFAQSGSAITIHRPVVSGSSESSTIGTVKSPALFFFEEISSGKMRAIDIAHQEIYGYDTKSSGTITTGYTSVKKPAFVKTVNGDEPDSSGNVAIP